MPDHELPLLYRGSVKDVYGIEGRDPYVFEFSDRYSIFDWGEMPDALSGKGEALAVMGDLCFRYLGEPSSWENWNIAATYPKFWRDSIMSSHVWGAIRREGLSHHSIGLVSASGEKLAMGKRSNRLEVRALGRPPAMPETKDGKLVWNYSHYQNQPENVLVPLEVVFRFGAPEGSSFLQRLKTIPNYAQNFGFTESPQAGEKFPYPIVEFFTKLEPTDRFLSRAEAQSIAALTNEEIDDLSSLTLLLALRLRDIFATLGLELWDGKFEFAFRPGATNRRKFLLVDSIGPDELRLIGPGGVHFSKEFLRRVYRGGEWYQALESAKKIAQQRGEKDWKKICTSELKKFPDPLPREALHCARALYPSLAQALASSLFQREIFSDAFSIADLCQQLRRMV